VFLEKLESGLLLFETPKGLVAIELSFWQRLYLLWTFRNFRRLSTRLLNSRQAALVNAIANNPSTIAPSYDPSLVIGIVENFSLPLVRKEAPRRAEIEVADSKIEAAALIPEQPSPQQELPSPTTEQTAEAPESIRAFRPRITWPRITWLRLTRPKLATAVGLLLLCIGSIIAWHRIDAVAGSEAHSRPHPIESTTSSTAPQIRETSAVVDSSAIASAPTKVTERELASSPVSTQGAAVDLVKPAATIATIPTHQDSIQRADSAPRLVTNPALTLTQSEIQASRPPLRSVYPDYSGLEARGVVALTAEVDSEGIVRSVRVVRGNRTLAAAAVRAVRQWRYSPYLKDGKSVPTETNIVISVFSDEAISMSFPPTIAVSH